ncbi:hypothetical protein NTGM5_130038 [Candidatus Nitrotoga sp. M5]|nr:hypothetical protein NTGM5_130038 [Candidatus Nitrotoga sp. M5]
METLKWGEPSYITKTGSAIKLGWRQNGSASYCNCNTKHLGTLRELYSDIFKFEGNRAILFRLAPQSTTHTNEKLYSAALTYHKVKHLPLLGA